MDNLFHIARLFYGPLHNIISRILLINLGHSFCIIHSHYVALKCTVELITELSHAVPQAYGYKVHTIYM